MPNPFIGPYELLEELTSDPLGGTYRAERDFGGHRRQFTLKLIDSVGVDELAALARLRHPNIFELVDSGRTEDGRTYLVTDAEAGDPIDCYCEKKLLAPSETAALLAQAARALYYAHQQLVAHLDLKPRSLLVVEDGTLRIRDFGLARIVTDDSRGVAADISALGRMLVQTVRGSEGGPELEAIAGQALRRRLDQSYASMGELAADLEAYANNQPVAAYPGSAVHRCRKFLKRHHTPFILAACLLTLAGLVVGTIRSVAESSAGLQAAQSERMAIKRLSPQNISTRSAWFAVQALLQGYSESLSRPSPDALRPMQDRLEQSLNRIGQQPLSESSAFELAITYDLLSCWQDEPEARESLRQTQKYLLAAAKAAPPGDSTIRGQLLAYAASTDWLLAATAWFPGLPQDETPCGVMAQP